MKRRFRPLVLAALLAILLGVYLARYTRPRTVEDLVPQFRWEKVERIEGGYARVLNTEMDRDWTQVLGFDSAPLTPQESQELLSLWQEAELRPKPLATLRRRHGISPGQITYHTGRRYYSFLLTLRTDLGVLVLSDYLDDDVALKWSSHDGQADQLWVVSPPPDLMAQTCQLLLNWAEHVEYDPE